MFLILMYERVFWCKALLQAPKKEDILRRRRWSLRQWSVFLFATPSLSKPLMLGMAIYINFRGASKVFEWIAQAKFTNFAETV